MPDGFPIRVLVVARSPIARAGLRRLLASPNIVVTGESAVLDLAGLEEDSTRPDVVLMEWEGMLDADALEQAMVKGVPVLLIGEPPPEMVLLALLRSGIRGFILTDVQTEDLEAAIAAIKRGLTVVDPAIVSLLTGPEIGAASALQTTETLTDREREVLQLLAQGLPNKTIAARLHISEHTVKFHVGAIMAKLGATSRTEALAMAYRQGLINL